jgi:hypothetical protein
MLWIVFCCPPIQDERHFALADHIHSLWTRAPTIRRRYEHHWLGTPVEIRHTPSFRRRCFSPSHSYSLKISIIMHGSKSCVMCPSRSSVEVTVRPSGFETSMDVTHTRNQIGQTLYLTGRWNSMVGTVQTRVGRRLSSQRTCFLLITVVLHNDSIGD